MTDDLEQKAKKTLEQYNNAKRPGWDAVCKKALLTKTERNEFEKYRGILEPKLVHYAPKWLAESESLNQNNRIKYIASVLVKANTMGVKGSVTDFIKKLFSNSMDYNCEIKENGFRLKPKSDQFEDIFFELELLEFFLDINYQIDLGNNKLLTSQRL